MKKKPALSLSIVEPCNENWEFMSPSEQGRHCAVCSKTVVDFTKMSNAQLLDFFKTSKDDVCGRLRSEQLNKEIKKIPIFYSTIRKWAMGLLLLFAADNSSAQQNDIEVIPLTGPGSEPIFQQTATDTTFRFTLVGGALNGDDGVYSIVVKRDIEVFEFERTPEGTFDIAIPRVWHDSFFAFSFFDINKNLIGKYEIPLKDAWKYADSKIKSNILPTAHIQAKKTIITMGGIGGGTWCPDLRIQTTRSTISTIEPVNINIPNNQGKIPVHVPGKVKNGTHDIPGVGDIPASPIPEY
ncbi:MAG: hypothetical protein IT244_09600 [Bacteroidia bacterium]|jgi:hypothetical protein|nr:hypothetical protein [Bacteroidia bacterium]